MKRRKNIYALHPEIKSEKDIIFTSLLENKYDFVWNEENPDYVVVTEAIYYDDFFTTKFKRYLKNENIIFIASFGEYISPDMNLFDYACVFERELRYSDRIIRIPTLIRYQDALFSDIPEKKVVEKRRFCDFIYSNPNAPDSRDNLFYSLNQYKRVDSLGPHLNNVGNQPTRFADDWKYQSIIERLPYKFSIAAENASSAGYITEKILCCMQAGSVPIYWGDPTIGQEFNEKRFVNCHKFKSYDEVVNEIRRIDHDEHLWEEMVSQPMQTSEQEEATKKEIKAYLDFLDHIFEQKLGQAKRRSNGYHPDLYRKWLYRESDIVFTSPREVRLKMYNEVYCNWIGLRNNGIFLEDIFLRKGWYDIALYGVGDLAKLLYDELESCVGKVKVVYALDRNKVSYKNLRVLSLHDKLERVDQIIVTIPDKYDEIKESVEKVTDMEIINVRDLLSEVFSGLS